MIWFLIAASGLVAFIRDYGGAMTLMAAMVPLVAMDAYLHRRTQASTQASRVIWRRRPRSTGME